MNDKFLGFVKGFNRTFVIHSNNNRYASAAMAGMIAVQSEEEGNYFQISDQFIPVLDSHAIEEPNIDSIPDQIEMNFKNDWLMYLRQTALPACDLAYDEDFTAEKNTIRFLNANRRRVQAKPRNTYASRELSIPPKYQSDYNNLLALIQAGGDLKPYLSRHILKKSRSDKNDPLLNSWGIHHLHFRPEGTDQLLFCWITDTDVFLIQALPHNAKHLWVDTQLIQIMHDNWPELIAPAKNDKLQKEGFSAPKRSSLRDYNANFPITVSDGSVYLPPTGGTMASGNAQNDLRNCDKIFSELEDWQSFIAKQALAIRAALNMPVSKKLFVHMAFDNRDCCFYEPTLAVRLCGFAS